MFFKKKKKEEGDEAAVEEAEATAVEEQEEEVEEAEEEASEDQEEEKPKSKVNRDRRKAASFFKHAATNAETRNYDYAIDLYIQGLSHDPDNMDKHEELRDVALRRKVAGGKPPKFSERFAVGAKEKIDKFLHAEKLWSKEPLSFARAMNAMEKAVEADLSQDEYNMGEVAHWIGVLVLEKSETDKQLKKEDYVRLKDFFGEVGSWEKARDACARAIDMDPTDLALTDELRDIEAEVTMLASYSEKPSDINFRDNIKDTDKQNELAAGDALNKTENQLNELIERARSAFDENPDDIKLREKLVSALMSKHDSTSENEAIELLKEAYAKTEMFKYKMQISDIQIRQADRKLKKLQAVAKQQSTDEAKAAAKQFFKKKLQFELQQFAERAKEYPTDMKWRYEIGKRFFIGHAFDKALEHLQKAKGDPKYKSAASNYLGQCYITKEWWDEAIDTLKDGLDAHRDTEDKLGKEMRYNLMTVLLKSAEEEKNVERAKEAQKVASDLLQSDINYKDIKDKLDTARKMVKALSA